MNVTFNSSRFNRSHNFDIEHEGVKYNVTIYVNESGKFIDEVIQFDDNDRYGEELGYEGTEGEIREAIVEYLSLNWDKLVTE